MHLSIPTSLIPCAAILLACMPALHAEPTPMEVRRASTQAIMNARQIGLMMVEFDTDYGSFPNAGTRADVEAATGKKLPADDKSSNAFFRQLVLAGIVENEVLFFASIPGTKKGDNDISAGKVLEKGENAFAYIVGLNTANGSTPLLLCPLVPGTTTFDPKPFGGKDVILWTDFSVRALPIADDGKVLVDGVDILSKDHPVWKGKAPDIRHPDLLPLK